MKLEMLSVNVARPEVLALAGERKIMSAIAKKPVAGPDIRILAGTLEGDAVADRRVHGGPDKAVYAYAADNWPWWRDEHGFTCAPGAFGENLTLSGADETQIRIGDRFQWGEALLEVAQPREPCFKFQIHTGRRESAALMTVSGRCGWYLRVLQPGAAAVNAPMERILASDGPTIRETFHALVNHNTRDEERQRIAAHPALARSFRFGLLR
jgi:MOSC domain-containing protein YiiM